MTREEALKAVKANVKNKNLIKHMLATEAIMRHLAVKFGQDEELWGLCGLLHDIDIDVTRDDMDAHSQVGADMVRKLGAGEEIAHAVLCHNPAHDTPRETEMDRAIYCVDHLTGLITAAVLVRPDKKLANLKSKSVLKRFREKSFAAGASREQIAACEELGLSLENFVDIGLTAMQSVADDLGL